jgi:hypothetical protein
MGLQINRAYNIPVNEIIAQAQAKCPCTKRLWPISSSAAYSIPLRPIVLECPKSMLKVEVM